MNHLNATERLQLAEDPNTSPEILDQLYPSDFEVATDPQM